MQETQHRLIFKSLMDLQAECSCGHWSITRTTTSHDNPEDIRREAKEEHLRHAARETAIELRNQARALGANPDAIRLLKTASTLFRVIDWHGHASDCDRDAERLQRLFPDD
jgi:hypothetical protein